VRLRPPFQRGSIARAAWPWARGTQSRANSVDWGAHGEVRARLLERIGRDAHDRALVRGVDMTSEVIAEHTPACHVLRGGYDMAFLRKSAWRLLGNVICIVSAMDGVGTRGCSPQGGHAALDRTRLARERASLGKVVVNLVQSFSTGSGTALTRATGLTLADRRGVDVERAVEFAELDATRSGVFLGRTQDVVWAQLGESLGTVWIHHVREFHT
jgi:hypothetical protein